MTRTKFHMRNTLNGLAILGIWTIGYALARVLFRTLSSANGCALLAGWWFVAYVCSKTTLGLRPALVAGGLFALSFIMLGSFRLDWFYHDVVGVSLPWLFLIGLLQGAVVASPIIFDSLVTIFVSRHRRESPTPAPFRIA